LQETSRSQLKVRKYPRLPVVTPVTIVSHNKFCVGRSENVSMGGMLVHCSDELQPAQQSEVRFNLPTGPAIEALSSVVHRNDNRIGLQFVNMDQASRKALSTFLQGISEYTRRSGRVAKRFSVALSRNSSESPEELAETVLLSRWGGLLVCRGKFKPGEQFYLWWPEGKKGAPAKVVLRHSEPATDRIELGFQFQGAENFWDLDFPPEFDT
jgi:hypothetical protein